MFQASLLRSQRPWNDQQADPAEARDLQDQPKKALADLERQRGELDEAIEDLREQLKWGEKIIASLNQPKRAAE